MCNTLASLVRAEFRANDYVDLEKLTQPTIDNGSVNSNFDVFIRVR